MLLLLLVLPFVHSCRYFEQQVPSKEALLQKELKAINWNEVDSFPSFSSCDSIIDKNTKRQCFFEFLTQLIQERLSTDTLTVLYPQLDTINLKVTVFPNSTMRFEIEAPTDSIAYDRTKIDSILHARLIGFPKVNPAIKRGIPVKTQFILPVLLKVE